ncbi:MAG: XTP/dITP diphosphatase [Armatimonadota bacterium]|nr:XTP/dITP diphosphatase [Armatimonadota bacterium]
MREIVIATRNRKKVEEIRAMLSELPIRILSLADFPELPEPQETGKTFAENAEIKALAAAKATGKIALADDSGLEVDALGGQPGVLSNRFAGQGASDRDKYMLVLRMMEGVPDEKRTARFRAAIAIARPDGCVVVVEGTCEGLIAHEPKGEYGFGYDPIFYLPDIGKTMAELTSEEKNKISHRAKAIQAAKLLLLKLVESNN